MSKDLYQILGVSRTASDDDIRRAYKRKAKESHPDLHPGDAAATDNAKPQPARQRREVSVRVDITGQ